MTRVPILIGEHWLHPEVDQAGPVHNPATGEVIGRVPLCGAAEVDQAVAEALRAFTAWGNTPPPKRARVLFRYRELFVENQSLRRELSRHSPRDAEAAVVFGRLMQHMAMAVRPILGMIPLRDTIPSHRVRRGPPAAPPE